jgi:hypothetical protein
MLIGDNGIRTKQQKDTKLLSYDACRMAFFPRKDGAQGTHGTVDDLVDSNDQLGLNSATIKLRSVHFCFPRRFTWT